MKREKLLKQLDWWRKVAHIGSTCKEGNVCDRAYKEIVAILKNQPTITEEWIDEKAKKLHEMSISSTRSISYTATISPTEAIDFIRSLVEELSITVDPLKESGKQ